MYDTIEPLTYYYHSKKNSQNILIIENKYTFYSMRKHLISDNNKIIGGEFSTLIYGGSKNINKKIKDFEYCVESYLTHSKNNIMYLGDLDYERIIIYESLKKTFENNHQITPFIRGYELMSSDSKVTLEDTTAEAIRKGLDAGTSTEHNINEIVELAKTI